MSLRIRRALVLGTAMVGMVAAGVISPARASASTATKCAITWGSLAKVDSTARPSPLVATRTGRHDCFDRVVFEMEGPASGYRVEYVRHIIGQPSGQPVPVAGGALLEVTLNVPTMDSTGRWTYPEDAGAPVHDVAGYRTLRDVVFNGSYHSDVENHTTFGVGVRARLPFRVFVLAGPGSHSRIVLDVAHRW